MLKIARFCYLILPDCLGCNYLFTLPVPSFRRTTFFFANFLTRPLWLRSELYLLPTPQKFRYSAHNRGSLPLFILHLDSSYSILTEVCKPRVGCKTSKFFSRRLFLLSVYILHEARTAWVRNCILATHWACSTRTWHVVASWLVRSSPDRAVRVRALVRGHCVVFLGKTLNSHGASLHPGV